MPACSMHFIHWQSMRERSDNSNTCEVRLFGELFTEIRDLWEEMYDKAKDKAGFGQQVK